MCVYVSIHRCAQATKVVVLLTTHFWAIIIWRKDDFCILLPGCVCVLAVCVSKHGTSRAIKWVGWLYFVWQFVLRSRTTYPQNVMFGSTGYSMIHLDTAHDATCPFFSIQDFDTVGWTMCHCRKTESTPRLRDGHQSVHRDLNNYHSYR